MSEPQAISGGLVLPYPTVSTEIEEDPSNMAPDKATPRATERCLSLPFLPHFRSGPTFLRADLITNAFVFERQDGVRGVLRPTSNGLWMCRQVCHQ
jgi:hypothetical protein